jgi:hypothetical protein
MSLGAVIKIVQSTREDNDPIGEVIESTWEELTAVDSSNEE